MKPPWRFDREKVLSECSCMALSAVCPGGLLNIAVPACCTNPLKTNCPCSGMRRFSGMGIAGRPSLGILMRYAITYCEEKVDAEVPEMAG